MELARAGTRRRSGRQGPTRRSRPAGPRDSQVLLDQRRELIPRDCAPTTESTTWPPLKISSVGMPRTGTRRRARVVVHVQLADVDAAVEVGRQLIDRRRDALAGAAPLRPEIHQHRPRRLQDSAEKLPSVNTFTFSEAMGSRRSLRIAVLPTIIAHKPVRTPALVVPTFSEMPAGVVPGYSEAIRWLKRPVCRSVPNRAT